MTLYGSGERPALVTEEFGFKIVSGSAAQLTGTKGPDARGEAAWIARASNSLPVPDSPNSNTVAMDGAACITVSMVRRQASDWPISVFCRSAASCARSERFSCRRLCFSNALLTARTTCARLSGLVTKS